MSARPTAMILAAGRGQRMRPLSDHTPKPLLPVAGKPLIVWQIERLVAAGWADIVINTGWLGQQIAAALGDGARFGARLRYSPEPPEAFETGGGVAAALPMLGQAPFLLVSGDVYTDYDYARLHAVAGALAGDAPQPVAHLVLVPNPPDHAGGDMALDAGGRVRRDGQPRWTYGNIGVIHPAVFAARPPALRWRLFPWLLQWADDGRITGEVYTGRWCNVGTPQQWAALQPSATPAERAAAHVQAASDSAAGGAT